MIIEKGSRAALVCCSDAQREKDKIKLLGDRLLKIGITPIFGKYIFAKDSCFGGSAEEKASELMEFYKDESIKAIFDISGGDVANEILSYLDYEIIKNSGKMLWGYSDLTTVINAIYAKTGKASVLYQVKNLINDHGEDVSEDFCSTVFEGKAGLFDISAEFLQGESLEGVVVGGNIRCLLKLAGTEYFPDMDGKVLLLESLGGGRAQVCSYFNQLYQMGIFNKVRGILLGTFTRLIEEDDMGYVFSQKGFAGAKCLLHTPI